ncbi:MAG: hypothetical protein ACFE9C_04580 [Candidatus Hodarchaeota archaeon]
MDITQFNKELANRVATAKRYEKSGDIKLAVKLWLEISEMAISLSKNPKLDASFKNMLMNRVKGIFEHVRILKSGEESYTDYVAPSKHSSQVEKSVKPIQSESETYLDQEINDINNSNSEAYSSPKIIEDSDLKNLPKGFKEIETSEDFEIITPHDKDFVKKQLDKALDSNYFKQQKQGGEGVSSELQKKNDFEQPKDGKYKICFACGYDKNLIKDKICKNCGTNLD